ncbi:MAG: 2Fe-2S iron-sulfur cluster binding domain-containing protein, partial [Proteobacteria bacterium]
MKFILRARGETLDLQFPIGVSLLEFLQSQEIPVNAACGGKGTCTKCRCRVEKGFLAVGVQDRKAFNESELQS